MLSLSRAVLPAALQMLAAFAMLDLQVLNFSKKLYIDVIRISMSPMVAVSDPLKQEPLLPPPVPPALLDLTGAQMVCVHTFTYTYLSLRAKSVCTAVQSAWAALTVISGPMILIVSAAADAASASACSQCLAGTYSSGAGTLWGAQTTSFLSVVVIENRVVAMLVDSGGGGGWLCPRA
jgi:hypothetical protein